MLEDRQCPAVYLDLWTYTGATPGDWNTAGNWSAGVPTRDANVQFVGNVGPCVINKDAGGNSPTVNSFLVNWNYNKTVTLNTTLTVLNGGDIYGTISQPNGAASDLYVNGGTLKLYDGSTTNSAGSASTIHVTAAGYLYLGNAATDKLTVGDNIDNQSGGDVVCVCNTATFTNNAGVTNAGQFDLSSGKLATSGSGVITNTGTFYRDNLSDGTVYTDLPILNSGASSQLLVQRGGLVVYGTNPANGVSVFQSAGTVALGSVSSQAWAGTLTVNAGYSQSGGILETLGYNSSSTINGNVTVSGGNIYIEPDYPQETSTLTINGFMTMNGGAYNVTVDVTNVAADQINATQGFLIGGTATLNVTMTNGTNNLEPGQVLPILSTSRGVITGDFSTVDAGGLFTTEKSNNNMTYNVVYTLN